MRRSLYQTGNDCRLGQAEVGGRMREELATGGIHVVSAPSEINLVQIKTKDLLLGEFASHGQRQNHFPELAGEAVAVRSEERRVWTEWFCQCTLRWSPYN